MKKRRWVSALLVFVGIPLLIACGVVFLRDRQYTAISLLIALLGCLPFFLAFEKRRPQARELVVIAVMSAISVMGRLLFSFVPGFKPVTAFTVLTGGIFGAESGFLTGAMTALVSNLFFGQGPWTPFQMLIWGLIGWFAGILGKHNWLDKRWVLVLYGIISGGAFSLCMDIWTVLSVDAAFSWARYGAAVLSSLPFMATYALSNVVFLLLLYGPVGKKLARLKTKYGIGPNSGCD